MWSPHAHAADSALAEVSYICPTCLTILTIAEHSASTFQQHQLLPCTPHWPIDSLKTQLLTQPPSPVKDQRGSQCS
jgi:hypothetical protein